MKQAFSLVELAIVLVIVGLLAGGILAGKSLIRASELRSVAEDWKKYDIAFNSFNDRNFGFPGDITTATQIWGAAAVCPGDYTTPATDKKTCDGNGNSKIDTLERYRAWQHMANDGLIDGSYTGVPYNASSASVGSGINTPKGRLSASFYQIYSTDATVGSAYFPLGTQHAIILANDSSPTIGSAVGVMSPEEAWNLDTKMDDGKPGYGIVMHYNGDHTTVGACVSSATAADAVYMLASSGKLCSPFYNLGL